MSFRISGLAVAPFQHLFGLPDQALAELGVQRYRASHAIFVLEGATTTYDQVNDVPAALRPRAPSVRYQPSNYRCRSGCRSASRSADRPPVLLNQCSVYPRSLREIWLLRGAHRSSLSASCWTSDSV